MAATTIAYNTGSPITGTTQIGSLAVGVPTSGYEGTGLIWFNGPNEDLGYVIGYSQSNGLHPATHAPGGKSSVGFKRTKTKTDAAFIDLANKVANGATGLFASASDAKTWLNANGYWTSWVPAAAAFSQLFTNGQTPGTTIENAWTTFRSQLTGSYTSFTFTSSLSGSTAYNVTDPTKVQTLATNLKNGTAVSVTIGGVVWLVGCCACRQGGSNANAVEFCNIAACSAGSTASLRPWINNANWGGIGATTNAATQTLTLSFS
jgi:hypothetical protein